jgi:hypothetical protein
VIDPTDAQDDIHANVRPEIELRLKPEDTRLGVSMNNHLLQTFRVLRREPGYAVAAVLAIALGIGATTTLFSVAYGVLLKPLPWPDPDRLVRLEERRGGRPGRVPLTITNGAYLSWAESTSLEAIGGWMAVTSTFTVCNRKHR